MVSDSALAPIRDAVVTIDGSGISVLTGANGRFRILALSPGSYDLRVRRLGFDPVILRVRVEPRDTVRLAISLERAIVVLDSMRVTAAATSPRLAEFEERRARGDGQFLSGPEIERRNVQSVLDLLRPFKGIRWIGGSIATNMRFGVIRDCPYQVFVDDVMIPTPRLADTVSPKDLAGIELYTSIASVPLRYKSSGDGATCGVILLWTKRGGM